MNLPPLSLYAHFPWCRSKCPYCDFNSHAHDGALPERRYADALLADLRRDAEAARGRRLDSIFIGGGTPSLMSARTVDRLLAEAARSLTLADDIEITLEANPESVARQKLADYRRAGVNRLSIGVQSFDDACLRALGRAHDAGAARKALKTARAAGFDNINIDLMFGLPGQTLEQARRDADLATACAPEHISCYQLTLEPNTLFHAHPPQLPDEDRIWKMECDMRARFEHAGFARYEVSAYAAPARRCRHNLNYWQFGDYLGIGAGAHGKLTLPAGAGAAADNTGIAAGARGAADGGTGIATRAGAAAEAARDQAALEQPPDDQPFIVVRTVKHRHPEKYMQSAPAFCSRRGQVPPDELPFEFMLNALRLTDGFTDQLFAERTGLAPAAVAPRLALLARDGLIERKGSAARPTPRGLLFLNELQAEFLPEGAAGLGMDGGVAAPLALDGGVL